MRRSVQAVSNTGALASLAEQLRDGPLHELMELHRRTTLLACEIAASDRRRLEQLTELALVSLTAMEGFQAFTRELRAQISELVDTSARELH